MCGVCGAKKWRDEAQDELEVPRALTLPGGGQVQPFAREEQRAVLARTACPCWMRPRASPLCKKRGRAGEGGAL